MAVEEDRTSKTVELRAKAGESTRQIVNGSTSIFIVEPSTRHSGVCDLGFQACVAWIRVQRQDAAPTSVGAWAIDGPLALQQDGQMQGANRSCCFEKGCEDKWWRRRVGVTRARLKEAVQLASRSWLNLYNSTRRSWDTETRQPSVFPFPLAHTIFYSRQYCRRKSQGQDRRNILWLVTMRNDRMDVNHMSHIWHAVCEAPLRYTQSYKAQHSR